MRPIRTLRAMSLILAALLAGCTTIRGADDPVQTPVEGETGTVVVSLTANTPEVSQFDSITVESTDSADRAHALLRHQFVLTNVLPSISRDTSLFVGALTPGNYRMVRLNSEGRFLDLPPERLSSFQVDARRTTDLGRLVLSSANERALIGRSPTVTGNEPFVRRYAADHLSLYTEPVAHGWDNPPDPHDITEAFARSHPLGAMDFRALGNGELVGGTRMGTFLVRGVDGHWRIAVTGGLEALTAVAPYRVPGYLAVGAGDLGSLIKLRDNGALEPVNPGDLPAGSIFFIDHSPDLQHWIVGVQRPGQAVLYAAEDLGGPWTEFGKLDTPFSFWSGPPHVWAWSGPGSLGFAASSSTALSCFDYANTRWKVGASPGKRELIAITPADDGRIGVITHATPGQSGDYTQAHLSADCGASWTRVPLPPKFDPETGPLRLGDGTLIIAGSGAQGPVVMRSTDQGQHWTPAGGPWVLRGHLWNFGPLLLAVTQREGIETLVTSTDEGRSWHTERSSAIGPAASSPSPTP